MGSRQKLSELGVLLVCFVRDQVVAQQFSKLRGDVMKTVRRVAMSVTATLVSLISAAPVAAADPTTHTKAEVDAARGQAGCPPFQVDPVLTDVSQRTAHEVDDYVRHAATFLPTTLDTDLLKALRETGYNTSNARLLNGYGDYRTGGAGDNEAKAIKGAVLQGWGLEALPDCSLTKYGISAINGGGSEGWPSTAPRTYAVVVVVLAGPNGH
jgi:hypothetical protein